MFHTMPAALSFHRMVSFILAPPQANCTDAKNCQQYADFFCSPSNPSGIDVCPIICKNPRCVGKIETEKIQNVARVRKKQRKFKMSLW